MEFTLLTLSVWSSRVRVSNWISTFTWKCDNHIPIALKYRQRFLRKGVVASNYARVLIASYDVVTCFQLRLVGIVPLWILNTTASYSASFCRWRLGTILLSKCIRFVWMLHPLFLFAYSASFLRNFAAPERMKVCCQRCMLPLAAQRWTQIHQTSTLIMEKVME
jgi:hypothetical protein